MSSIPGLDFCSVSDDSGDGTQVPNFHSEMTVIPRAQRFGNCRPQQDFEKLGKISEGSFGTVYKCRDKRTGEIVALKKTRVPNDIHDGIPASLLREINILNSLKHVNILNSRCSVAGPKLESNYMLMDYCPFSLDDLIEKNIDAIFEKPVIKCIMKQLLEGLEYIHGGLIVHRNVTCQNIVFHESGILKITGFETSRFLGASKMTPGVTPLQYRAPELFLRCKRYESSADMWSTGCVFAKLLLKQFLFTGSSEMQVLTSIFDVLGTPSEVIWPGFNAILAEYENGHAIIDFDKPYSDLKRYFVGQPASVKDMIQDLLLYYPDARLTAQECLKCFYFTESPKECSIEDLAAIVQKIEAPSTEPMATQ